MYVAKMWFEVRQCLRQFVRQCLRQFFRQLFRQSSLGGVRGLGGLAGLGVLGGLGGLGGLGCLTGLGDLGDFVSGLTASISCTRTARLANLKSVRPGVDVWVYVRRRKSQASQ